MAWFGAKILNLTLLIPGCTPRSCKLSKIVAKGRDQRRYDEAEAMNRRALEGREKVLAVEHPDTDQRQQSGISAFQDRGDMTMQRR